MKTTIILILFFIFLGLGVWGITSLTGSTIDSKLPYYARASPAIQEAYQFAVDNPEALNGVNCYCGCMQHPHDGRIHSRGLLDCFMKPDGSFEQHAANCDMCIRDALTVKSLTEQGLSKEQINTRIAAQYMR